MTEDGRTGTLLINHPLFLQQCPPLSMLRRHTVITPLLKLKIDNRGTGISRANIASWELISIILTYASRMPTAIEIPTPLSPKPIPNILLSQLRSLHSS